MALIKLNIKEELEIKILEFLEINLGEEPIKDSFEAYFPCEVVWTGPETPEHIVALDSELSETDKIWIKDWSKSHIKPGIYRKVAHPEKLLFERIDD